MARTRSLLVASSLVGVALFALLVANCGGREDHHAGGVEESDASFFDVEEDVIPVDTACDPLGQIRECSIPLGIVNGVKSCAIGQQVCRKTATGAAGWSECSDPTTIAAILNEMVANGDITP